MFDPFQIFETVYGNEIEVEILDVMEYGTARYAVYRQWDPFLEEDELTEGILRIWMKNGDIYRISEVEDKVLLEELMQIFLERMSEE